MGYELSLGSLEDIKCPHCGVSIYVERHSRDGYGYTHCEPEQTECPSCEEPIIVWREVEIQSYVKIPKEKSNA